MSPSSDWLPSREERFVILCEKWSSEFKKQGNAAFYDWDVEEMAETSEAIDAFLTARAAYVAVNSTKNRIAKDEAMIAAKAAMRSFANTSIRFNKKMDRPAKSLFGVNERDSVLSAMTEINSHPEGKADTSIIRQVSIHFTDSVSKRRGKPRGVHGALGRYAILDHVPLSVDELVNAEFCTASPLVIKADESDRGKKLYYCLRWETNTNIKGPWSEIYSTVIP